MLASAARTYLHRYGVRVGSRVVVLAGCDAAYGVALDLQAGGIGVEAIADVRTDASAIAPAAIGAARAAKIRIIERATVLGTAGRLRVNSVGLWVARGRIENEHGSARVEPVEVEHVQQ